MSAYNLQGAPALGKLPGLPVRRHVTVTELNQYYSAGLSEKIVEPLNATFGIGSGATFWATGRAANTEGLGLAYYQQSSTGIYYLQAFTYGNDAFQMRGSAVTAAHTSSMFGANTLRLPDGTFLCAHRSTMNRFCLVAVDPNTYAVTQTDYFIKVPNSGVCVSGEAFTCSTGADFGYSYNLGPSEPNWFVDGSEVVLFGTLDIAGAAWVAAFVFNITGQLVRVHKLFTYTRQTGSTGTYLHVRRVNAYYLICVLNRGPSSAVTMIGRYVCCSADFVSDISIVFGEVSWDDSSNYYNKLIMAADSKTVLFFIASTNAPKTMYTSFARFYKLDEKGKPIASANNQLPSFTINRSGSAESTGLMNDLLYYTTYSSSEDAFIRAPNYMTLTNLCGGNASTGGYFAVSLRHDKTAIDQAHIYKGGYRFKTLSGANGDLLLRFCPQVAVNQVDDSVSYSNYAEPLELFELSSGYWLGLSQLASSNYRLQLYKVHA